MKPGLDYGWQNCAVGAVMAITSKAGIICGNGSNKDSIGSWPEKEIFARQAGTNRNAKLIK